MTSPRSPCQQSTKLSLRTATPENMPAAEHRRATCINRLPLVSVKFYPDHPAANGRIVIRSLVRQQPEHRLLALPSLEHQQPVLVLVLVLLHQQPEHQPLVLLSSERQHHAHEHLRLRAKAALRRHQPHQNQLRRRSRLTYSRLACIPASKTHFPAIPACLVIEQISLSQPFKKQSFIPRIATPKPSVPAAKRQLNPTKRRLKINTLPSRK